MHTGRALAETACAHAQHSWHARFLKSFSPLLSVLSSSSYAYTPASPQIAMHAHDQIAPASCLSLGFPYLYPPPDHCYTSSAKGEGMHIWTRTTPIQNDRGILESEAVESNLTTGVPNGFIEWAHETWPSFPENVAILNNSLACNCLAASAVGKEMGNYCWGGKPGAVVHGPHSPVRDWWNPA